MGLHRRSARLSSWQLWLILLSGAALWLSGAVWLALHYFGQVEGEFGVEPNPLEPWFLRLHGLAEIPALLAIGGLFIAHIPKGWTHRHQRLAGVSLCAALSILIASGYLLYYASGEQLRASTSVLHWVCGLMSLPVFLWHYLNGRRIRRDTSAVDLRS